MYEWTFQLYQKGKYRKLVLAIACTMTEAVSILSDEYKGVFRYHSCSAFYEIVIGDKL